MLFVSAAEDGNAGALMIPMSQLKNRNGVRISNAKFIKIVTGLTGWAIGSVHRLAGEFVPDLNMVAFRINGSASEVL
jgi:hypothetical protein